MNTENRIPHMETGQWYRPIPAREQAFCEMSSCNKKIWNYINNRPFQAYVTYEGDLKQLKFIDGPSMDRMTALPDISEATFGNWWICGTERACFEKCNAPLELEKNYGCIVPVDHGYGLTEGMTLAEAEEYAKKYAKENDEEVIVFKGISRFRMVNEPKLEKAEY